MFFNRSDMANQKPIRELKIGSVRAAIWQVVENGCVMLRVTFRCCTKEDGLWRDEESFGIGELPLVACAAEMALAWIYARRGIDSTSSK